jgi:hypothetical protein
VRVGRTGGELRRWGMRIDGDEPASLGFSPGRCWTC